VWLILAFFLLQCQKRPQGISTSVSAPIVFAYYFENFAWGYQYRAWFVDSLGYVYRIEKGRNAPFHAQPDSLFTRDQLLRLKQNAQRTENHLNPDQLLLLYSLLKQASQGKIGNPVGVCVDAGIYAYYGFLPVPDLKKGWYRAVLLVQGGDTARINYSPVTFQLVQKLRWWVEKDSLELPCLPQ